MVGQTAEEVHKKLKNLKQDYYKLKDHKCHSGSNRPINKLYEEIELSIQDSPFSKRMQKMQKTLVFILSVVFFNSFFLYLTCSCLIYLHLNKVPGNKRSSDCWKRAKGTCSVQLQDCGYKNEPQGKHLQEHIFFPGMVFLLGF